MAARIMGVLILVAFLTWGGGMALVEAGSGAGLPVAMASAPVVAGIGLLAFHVLGPIVPVASVIYLSTRVFEAGLLAVSAALTAAGVGIPGMENAGHLAYLAAMAGLGLGSLPFLLVLRHRRIVPGWLALWGVAGYAALTVGMMVEMTAVETGLGFLLPGGLFKVSFAGWLIVRGFETSAPQEGGSP